MVIIAGSHDEAGANLSTFSNAAGSGQQHYLVALGESVRTINHEGTAVAGDGTSFATPQIAGAAALLAQAFPHLSGAQIVDILFDSAIDMGATGTDTVFGPGKLPLPQAFDPQGPPAPAASHTPVPLPDKRHNGKRPER